jgi:hypothetical protein
MRSLFLHSVHLLQEVMKGVQLVYDFATFRRPSQMMSEPGGTAPIVRPEDVELQVPLNPNPQQQQQQQPTLSVDGHDPPGTPALSTFEVDDEFNLPISVAIVILLIYIFVGAIIYWTWEEWGFFESFYFVFISMSTIGFGDFVPQVCSIRRDIQMEHQSSSRCKLVGFCPLCTAKATKNVFPFVDVAQPDTGTEETDPKHSGCCYRDA